MYGWTECEALAMNAAKLIPEERLQEFQQLIGRIKKGEAVGSFNTRRITKSGDILDVRITVTALTDESGRPVEMALTERDLVAGRMP